MNELEYAEFRDRYCKECKLQYDTQCDEAEEKINECLACMTEVESYYSK